MRVGYDGMNHGGYQKHEDGTNDERMYISLNECLFRKKMK